jgi:CDP-diglyceride synthetase
MMKTFHLWSTLALLSLFKTASSFTSIHHPLVTHPTTARARRPSIAFQASVDDIPKRGESNKERQKVPFGKRPDAPKRDILHIYTEYASRLWQDTNPEARKRIANDRAAALIRQVQQIVREDEYIEFSGVPTQARDHLVEACDSWLKAVDKSAHAIDDINGNAADSSSSILAASTDEVNSAVEAPKKPKKQRSVLFGAAMGSVVAAWVFSGNYIFTGLFTLMTILGQLEYYRLVMNTGVYPARRISVIGACSMFLTALFTPDLHQICLPLFGLWAMVWFLTMRRTVTSIPEIATTFTGMFYLGYVPSFWVRIRLLGGGREPTRLAAIAGPVLHFLRQKAETKLPSFIPQAVHLPITTGAIFIFWTWLCLAFSDVGAYFVGKSFGKTKLGEVAPAAGVASPNKTVEGVLGGCAVSAMLGMLGAWVQNWPLWAVTGAVHGVCLGLLGLLGDLTASMLKRDGGLKDFGNLIPEHGGILDRVDSFIWTAPYSWVVATIIIPWMKLKFR